MIRIKKAVALCALQGRITLYDTESGEQWLSNGCAMYRLEGLPRLTIDQLCTMHDITGKKLEKIYCSQEPAPESLCLDDVDLGECAPTLSPLRIVCTAAEIVPCLLDYGLSDFNARYMEPIAIEAEYFGLTARHTPNGNLYFAVKDGLCLQAVIMPWSFEGLLSTEIKRLAQHAALGTVKTSDLYGKGESEGDGV